MEHIFILTDFVFWAKTKTHGLFLPLRTTMRISPCHVPLLSGGLLTHSPHLRIRGEQGLAYRLGHVSAGEGRGVLFRSFFTG